MTDIKPCPACGAAKPAFVRQQGRYPAQGQMACHECGARGPLAWTLEEARDRWNAMPRTMFVPSHPSVKDPEGSFSSMRNGRDTVYRYTHSIVGSEVRCDACGRTEPFGTDTGLYCRGCGRKVMEVV